jgi:V8-like Glu-specific endopeptidase
MKILRTLTASLSFLSLVPAAFALRPSEVPDSFPKVDGMVLASGCSASLVAFTDSHPSDRALVLTNGHCIHRGSRHGIFPAPGEVFVNEDARTTQFYLFTRARVAVAARAERLLYATMTGSDIALFELPATYAELERQDIFPLTIDPVGAWKVGDVWSLPTSYWKTTYQCVVEGEVGRLREDVWSWTHAVRLAQENCALRGGASGSPLLNSAGRVIGLINTVNDGGAECTLNNPCEVAPDNQVTVRKGKNYGFPVHGLYQCRAAGRQLDFTLPECPLGKL